MYLIEIFFILVFVFRLQTRNNAWICESITYSVFLLAPKKFRSFSKFYHFYKNNDNNIPYVSI